MAIVGTKQKLLTLIDDIEIVSKELFEVMSTPKSQQKTDSPDTILLMELLVQKDKEIKDTLKIAEEQGHIQKTIDDLKLEVEKRDHDIKNLQKNLKEAETILATAIYQAKQKLTSISQANKRTISSEELIKFAHKISASNAIAAPPTWAPGDPRRPYPTDFEMRHGYLGKLSDLPINNQVLQMQSSFTESMATNRTLSQLDHLTSSQPSTVTWQPQPPELPITTNMSMAHHGLNELRNHHNEDVEIMSSDSSSSSSSDE